MKIIMDITEKKLIVQDGAKTNSCDLYSKKAFELVSDQWLKMGWNEKYLYTFTWLGRPVIQLPDDLLRIQEVVVSVRPDVIIETGVAHGGSLIFYASLCKVLERGRVIGIDIEIRPHNRKAIEAHPLKPYFTLIEGSSTDPVIVNSVKEMVEPHETVLVILDSCHTKSHVLNELNSYCDLVTPGSYIVATDGSMKDLYDVPRGKPEWKWDNPTTAAAEFAKSHTEFVLEQPEWLFNESDLEKNITHWPGAYLRRQ